MTDELGLYDDECILSKKKKLLKIGKALGVEAKTCNEIPNNGFNMADMEIKGIKLMQSKQIFKEFSDQITYLICPNNPNFHE